MLLLLFVCSSEADYDDFELIEQDEVIESECSDEDGN